MSLSRALTLLLLWLPVSLAEAASQRTFVATSGNDANACTLALPCRGFARALTQTNAGGEIIVLDSGGYGTVTIGKSVSIVAPSGVYAGVSVASGTGIVVNGAGIKVELRGLTIVGLGGNTGINLQNAANVVIADCRVSGMTGSGLANTGAANVHVQDSTFRDNAGVGVSLGAGNTTLVRVMSRNNAGGGVAATGAVVSLVDGQIHSNGGAGVVIDASGYASVNNTAIQSNSGSGVEVLSGASARLDRAVVSINGQYGMHATSGLRVWIVRSTIHDNRQLNPNVSEVCACAAFTSVHMTDNTVDPYSLAPALEAVLDSSIILYTNNAIVASQTGAGTILSIPLR